VDPGSNGGLGGSTGAGSNGGSGGAPGSAGYRVGGQPSPTGSLTLGDIALPGISLSLLVPSLVVTAPGLLLLLLAILAQGFGGMAWLPLVRRWLGDFGVQRRRQPRP
jgi:hypothetical protein